MLSSHQEGDDKQRLRPLFYTILADNAQSSLMCPRRRGNKELVVRVVGDMIQYVFPAWETEQNEMSRECI